MKTLALATTALMSLSAAAIAADLPRRAAPPPAPYVAVPVFTWTGAYFGVNAGYINQDTSGTTFSRSAAGVINPPVALPQPFGVKTSTDGFIGGGQVGYNYQFGSVVVGVEGDFQGTNARFSRTSDVSGTPLLTGAAGLAGTQYAFGEQIGYLGTVRGRLGYTFDRLMVYGTGGYAIAGVRTGSTLNFAGANPVFAGSTTKDRDGYVVGGGVEYALTSALSAKIEGLYYDLDKSRVSATRAPVTTGNVFGINTRTDGYIVRGGVNYRFNPDNMF